MDVQIWDGKRLWSWAASEVDARLRRHAANKLIGERIREVLYFELDYRRDELHPELAGSGPRLISSQSEWQDPMWLFDGFDSVDYGLEIRTDSGACFSLTWDPPGEHEGIGCEPIPMLGTAVGAKADVALWSVGNRSPGWTSMIGHRVVAVDLHYQPWDRASGSLWCPHITLHGETHQVDIILGDAQDDALVPSANNVAVLHPGSALPTWADSQD